MLSSRAFSTWCRAVPIPSRRPRAASALCRRWLPIPLPYSSICTGSFPCHVSPKEDSIFRCAHQIPSQGWTRRASTSRPPFGFVPSAGQLEIAKLCEDHNVVVSARPGSGKTATAEAIIAAHPDKRVLVLTYSKRLQLETKRRLALYNNCEVLTFHALAGRLFGTEISNDTKLATQSRLALETGRLPRWTDGHFDIIVLDEFQDCTAQLFWLVSCLIAANHASRDQSRPAARLVVLGDERQAIYEYRGADQRFITLAPDLFRPLSPYPFTRVSLSQSFRLSDPTVRFVNEAFLGGEPYMTSSKPGPCPTVLLCNVLDTRSIVNSLFPLIQSYKPRNSALIAPSIRSLGSPIQKVTNVLSENCHVPIAVSINEEAPLDDRVIHGKLCVSTIHQFKGSERDLIVLFNLDDSYFRTFSRSLPDNECPNAVFVALTRAAKKLVLVHNERKKPMPFFSIDAMNKTAEVINLTRNKRGMMESSKPFRGSRREIGVSQMTRHIRDDLLDGIIDRHVDIRQLRGPGPKEEHIQIMNLVLTNRRMQFREDVSDINGLAIVAAFEHAITGRIKMFNSDTSSVGGIGPTEEIPDPESEGYPSWLCRKACDHEAKVSGYIPRKIQMEHHKFDWMKPQDLARARRRLQAELAGQEGTLNFERQCQRTLLPHTGSSTSTISRGVGSDNGAKSTRIEGRADIVSLCPSAGNAHSRPGTHAPGLKYDSIWEIKFVSEISHQHVLQACTYAYLLAGESEEQHVPRILLFNVKTGEKLEIVPRDGVRGLGLVVQEALEAKYMAHQRMKDEEFLEMCAEISREVAGLR